MKKQALFIALLCWGSGLVAQVFNSSNLPILVIETNGINIVDEPKVNVEMGLIYQGPGLRNHINDPFNEYEGWAGIEFRGSTSQTLFEKKSYALETRDDQGDNRNVSLLGLPEENDWVLNGPYSDKSLIRNAMAYQIAESFMVYAPRTRFLELVIDGEYQGVYLLLEKIKRDKNRVAISKLTPDDQSGEELTGGYILKIDKNSGLFSTGFLSEYPPQPGAWQQTFFQYHDPKSDELIPEQVDYIQGFMQDFEDLMASDNYADSIAGYTQYIDVESFVDYFIVNELCKNVDAYRLSTYFYKDRDSVDPRLKMGPVWDFNLGFGNVDFCLGAGVAGWVKDFNGTCPNDNWIIHFWWDRLWADQRFRQVLEDRWRLLRQRELSDESLFNRIDSLANLLEEAQGRNFERWPVLEQYIWPNWFVGDTYKEEVDYLRTWLTDRLIWMDGQMENVADVIYSEKDYFDPIAYPNPFQQFLQFQYYARRKDLVEVNLYNARGQLVATQRSDDHPNGRNEFQLDLSQVAPGMYFYQFWIDGEGKTSGKIVKAP